MVDVLDIILTGVDVTLQELDPDLEFEIALGSCFDFEMKEHDIITNFNSLADFQYNPNLYFLKEIENILHQRWPLLKYNRDKLRQVLVEMCGQYSGTTGKLIFIKRGKLNEVTIENGCVRLGMFTKYFMPPQKK